MEFKNRQEALDFIFKYRLDVYPPVDYDELSDEEIYEQAYEVYELLQIMERNHKLKQMSIN